VSFGKKKAEFVGYLGSIIHKKNFTHFQLQGKIPVDKFNLGLKELLPLE
jgi:hypothetical protein